MSCVLQGPGEETRARFNQFKLSELSLKLVIQHAFIVMSHDAADLRRLRRQPAAQHARSGSSPLPPTLEISGY